MIASALLCFLLPALVSAHGFVNKVTIDGTEYPGNPVGTSATMKSAIRQVNTNSPVKGAANPDINCGPGAQMASDVATANPGSKVQVSWVGGTTVQGSPWPHNTGPIMHYMAMCQGSCANYDSSGAKWFKISEQGQQPGGSTWFQAQIQSGSPAEVTIPSNLAPGNYLLRSELITLQLAMSPGGAEFYPSCIQLSVGGSQTGQPSSSDEVAFPGAYSDTDPGILTPNVYNPGFNYTFPGPPVASFISGSGSGSSGGSGSGSSGGPGSSASAAHSTAPGSQSTAFGASTFPGHTHTTSSLATPSATPSAAPPSSPTVGGDYSSGTSAAGPSSTGGSGSTCKHNSTNKRTIPEGRISVDRKRMHRRRYAPVSH